MRIKRTLALAGMLALCAVGFAQEKLKIELKNGQVVSYNASDVNRFYFEGQTAPLAANCGITFNDELALTDELALDVTYESDVETVLVDIFSPSANLDAYTDDQMLSFLQNEGTQLDKSTTVITATNMPEGTELTVVLCALNSKGQRGPVYRRKMTTHVEAGELKAPVTSCKFNSTNFFFDIEIDDEKVLKYYLLDDIGDEIEIMNEAAFGMLFRRAIATDPERGVYYEGKNFTRPRTNGEKQLFVATWALDFHLNYAGYIFFGLYDAEKASSRIMRKGTGNGEPVISAYDKTELMRVIKGMNIRVVNVK